MTASNKPIKRDVVIVGAGFSGIGMGKALAKRGGISFEIIDKAPEFGGTWYWNKYPGLACDIPSYLYSYKDEPSTDWDYEYSYGPQIKQYLQGIVRKYKLHEHASLNTEVDSAFWGDYDGRWHIYTTDGREFVARFLVSGIGALHIPSIPDIKGRNDFAGEQFHSAEWHENVDLSGKRVAVIGTGASAVQIVPSIVNQVSELHLFQRTPVWVMPLGNHKFSDAEKFALKRIPGVRQAYRKAIFGYQEALGIILRNQNRGMKVLRKLATWNINRSISDPVLRAKLTPNYEPGCKRLGKSLSYYPAIANAKSTLVTESIAKVTEKGIVTDDGIEHEVDVIIWATGFVVTDSYKYLKVFGRQCEDLIESAHRDGLVTHRGIMRAGVPNLFFLLGPNTGLGHNSVVLMIEAQIKYVLQAMDNTRRRSDSSALMPTAEAQQAYNDEVQAGLAGTVWNTGGCASWYFDEHGVNRTLWSGSVPDYEKAVKKFDDSEYEFIL